MATTTFQTKFLIGAKYTGASEVTKANRGIDSVERNLKGLGRGLAGAHKAFLGFGKIAGGVFAGIAAAAVTRRIIGVLDDAIDAAMGVAKAHDQLGAALERNKTRFNMTGKSIEEQKKRFITLAEAQEKAGGFDAEMMERGYSKLLDTMSPGQIERFSKSYSDMIAKLTDGQPTEEDIMAITQAYNLALKQGSPRLLKRLNLSKKEIETFSKLKSQEERRLFLEKAMLRFQGETQRQSETTSGKIRRMRDALGNLLETLGQPFAERAGRMTDAFIKLSPQLAKIAELISKKLADALEGFADWFDEHGDEVVKHIETLGKQWDKSIEDTSRQLNTLKGQWETSVADTKSQLDTIWGNIQSGFAAAKRGAGEFRTAFIAEFNLTNAEIPEPLKKIYETITSWFKKAYDKVIEIWKPLNQKLWEGFSAVPPEQAIAPTTGTGVGGGGGQPGDYVPPWQEPISSSTPTTGDSPALRAQRARLIAEMNANPALREKLQRVAQAETGTSDPTRLKAFYETVFNRAAVRNQTLARTLQPDYYETLRGGRTGHTPVNRPLHESTLKAIASGSNVSDYATGNFAYRGGGLGGRGGYPTKWFGEQFSVQAADVKKIEELKKADRAAKAMAPKLNEFKFATPEEERRTGGKGPNYPAGSLDTTTRSLNKRGGRDNFSPISLTLSPQTTINGASAGQEQALLRQHERILQNNNREFIAKLKEIQNDVARTTYV